MDVPSHPLLKPSTIQTIYEQLEFQRVQRPTWVAYHFPKIDQRGRVEYSDVEGMSAREADSVRQLLANQILWGRKNIAKQKARSVTLVDDNEPDEGDSEWSIRVSLIEEALQDLCDVSGLRYPL